MINKFRKELELPPQKAYHMDAAPMLCFYSEEVRFNHRIVSFAYSLTCRVVSCLLFDTTRWLRARMTGPSS
jgi:hypothetical protein